MWEPSGATHLLGHSATQTTHGRRGVFALLVDWKPRFLVFLLWENHSAPHTHAHTEHATQRPQMSLKVRIRWPTMAGPGLCYR